MSEPRHISEILPEALADFIRYLPKGTRIIVHTGNNDRFHLFTKELSPPAIRTREQTLGLLASVDHICATTSDPTMRRRFRDPDSGDIIYTVYGCDFPLFTKNLCKILSSHTPYCLFTF